MSPSTSTQVEGLQRSGRGVAGHHVTGLGPHLERDADPGMSGVRRAGQVVSPDHQPHPAESATGPVGARLLESVHASGPRRVGSGSASTPAARSPTSSPSTRTPASWSRPRPRPRRQPGRRVPGRHRQGARRCSGVERRRHRRGQPRHHGRDQPAARGQGRPARLHHHRGLRGDARDRPAVGAGRLRQLLLLGEAAPDRAARPGQGRSAAGSTSPAPRCGPSTRTAPARSPAGSATRASTPSASASCTPTPTRSTRSGCARCCAEEHPDAVVSHLQRGAARVPRVRARDDHAGRRRREAAALGVRHQHQGPADGATTSRDRSRST